MFPFPHANGATVIATSGGYLDLAAPRPDDIRLSDIALGLSRLARFTGQGRHAVSVARHSVNCYREAVALGLPEWVCRLALMHDATEAYIGDVSRPLKGMLPDYARIERAVWLAICQRFDLVADLAAVKFLDNLALATEAAILFPDHEPFPGFPAPGFAHGGPITTQGAAKDEADFLAAAERVGIA